MAITAGNINMRALCKMLGVNENTLRAWERRHGAITPDRGPTGRRLFNSRDVERIRLLWNLVKRGHSIGQIAGLSDAKLERLLRDNETTALEMTTSAPVLSLDDHFNEVISALHEFDLERLHIFLSKARFERSPKEIVTHLILPLLKSVGDSVAQGKLSIAQEHLFSAFLRDFLGGLFQSLNPYDLSGRESARNVALTTRENDLHEFGILLAAILCASHRWRTYYLGPNLPAPELADACNQFGIETLVLGLSALPARKEVVTAEEYLKILDRKTRKETRFLLGGSIQIDLGKFGSSRDVRVFPSLEELDQFLART